MLKQLIAEKKERVKTHNSQLVLRKNIESFAYR